MAKQLLSPEQIEGIKDALEDVTFTFFKEKITYYRWLGSLNRWNEDRDSTAEYEVYNLLGLIDQTTYKQANLQEESTGEKDNQLTGVSFNFRDLKALGLTNGNKTIIDPTKDYFTYENTNYNFVAPIITDGFFNEEPVLVIINVVKQENKT